MSGAFWSSLEYNANATRPNADFLCSPKLPYKIYPSDLDIVLEFGPVVILEGKCGDAPLSGGQRMMLEKLRNFKHVNSDSRIFTYILRCNSEGFPLYIESLAGEYLWSVADFRLLLEEGIRRASWSD
jgi:hypothetical protein